MIERRREAIAQPIYGRRLDVFRSVHDALPLSYQTGGIVSPGRGEVPGCKSEAVPLSTRVANRNLVNVREAGQHASIEQRQRGAALGAIPEQARRCADIVRKGFGPDIQIVDATRRAE